jgi:hypothetical protein
MNISYQYTPLRAGDLNQGPETRLVLLHPAVSHFDDLHCELRHIRLQDDGLTCPIHLRPDDPSFKFGRRHGEAGGEKYSALSYAWGELAPSIAMSCGTGTLKITENLDEALRHLRKPAQILVLWIDAISIDQNNVQERTEQVRIMGRIFHQAEKVVVWLGSKSALDEDHVCLDAFSAVAALVNQQVLLPLNAPDRESVILRTSEEIDCLLQTIVSESSSYLERFFSRRWFARRWVIQEVVLAHDAVIVCGTSSINWNDFEKALSELHHRYGQWVKKYSSQVVRGTIESLHWSRLAGHRLHWQHEPSPLRRSPLDTLCQYSTMQCQDDRDRVFALSGIIEAETVGADNTTLAASREWNTDIGYFSSVEAVYTAFARWQVRSYPLDGRLLLAAGIFRESSGHQSSMPSWVPDWRCSPRYSPAKNSWRDGNKSTDDNGSKLHYNAQNHLFVLVGKDMFTTTDIFKFQNRTLPEMISAVVALRDAYERGKVLAKSKGLDAELRAFSAFETALIATLGAARTSRENVGVVAGLIWAHKESSLTPNQGSRRSLFSSILMWKGVQPDLESGLTRD